MWVSHELHIWTCGSSKRNCKSSAMRLQTFLGQLYEIYVTYPLEVVDIDGRVCLIFSVSENKHFISKFFKAYFQVDCPSFN